MDLANAFLARPLLRARTEDGSHWMFVFLPDDRWVITRNGREVATGSGYRTSVNRGVDKFRSITAAGASPRSSQDENPRDSSRRCAPASVGQLQESHS